MDYIDCRHTHMNMPLTNIKESTDEAEREFVEGRISLVNEAEQLLEWLFYQHDVCIKYADIDSATGEYPVKAVPENSAQLFFRYSTGD